MYKIFLICSLIILSVNIVAQTPAKVLTKKDFAVKQLDFTLAKSTVIEVLRKCMIEIDRGIKDGEAMPSREYSSYDIKLKTFLKKSLI